MRLTRRHLLPLSATLLAPPLRARAAAADAPLVIAPITPTSRERTPYALLANMGPRGYPDGPVRIDPAPGLSLQIWLPPGPAPSRAVVFSHAELALPGNYHPLLRHWASHGFAVIAPLHDDSVVRGGLMARQQDARGGRWDPGAVFRDPGYWRARPRDCRAALDALPRLEVAVGARISDERPIIVGHGFGAFAAQLLLGVRASPSGGEPLSEADPRFYAAGLLSPQGRGVLGLAEDSWDGLARPILVATGNGDLDATGQDPNDKLDPFALSPPGNRHLAWFGRMNHTLWGGDQARPGTAQEMVFQDLLAVTTAFLVGYGDYDKDTFGLLAGDYFEQASGGRLIMRYR